jgi:hypothetical protein
MADIMLRRLANLRRIVGPLRSDDHHSRPLSECP